MATVNKFEDLEVWQMARKYAGSIHEHTRKEKFAKEYKFKDQIKDSSGSVMDNIAEGFGRESRLEFINFLALLKDHCTNTSRNYIGPLITVSLQKKFWICIIRKLKLLPLKLRHL